MKMVVITCILCIGLVIPTTTCRVSEGESANRGIPSTSPFEKDTVNFLKAKQISMFREWAAEENNQCCVYIVQGESENNLSGERSAKLSILQKNGTLVYEESFDNVESAFTSFALRKPSPQLIIVAENGPYMTVRILDYREGKVVNLLDPSEIDGESALNIELQPQYRSGVNPALEPYELLVTTGIGLASPTEKYTRVYRYVSDKNRFVFWGQFDPKKAGDYVDSILKLNKKQPRTNNAN